MSAMLGPVRPVFRALAGAVVPEARGLTASGWAELEATVEAALAKRPASVRRQVAVFLRVLDVLPVLRWGRRLRRLEGARREAFLRSIERSRVFLLRRGFWGVRTLVFMGYYTRPGASESVGYHARLRGWLEHPDAPASARALLAERPEPPSPVDA